METLIQKAVDLWAEQITNGLSDNGGGADHFMLLNFAKSSSQPTPQELEKFKEALYLNVEHELRDSTYVTLSVDYDPDEILFQSCLVSGVLKTALPVKSTMYIDGLANRIRYRFGYGNESQIIQL